MYYYYHYHYYYHYYTILCYTILYCTILYGMNVEAHSHQSSLAPLGGGFGQIGTHLCTYIYIYV